MGRDGASPRRSPYARAFGLPWTGDFRAPVRGPLPGRGRGRRDRHPARPVLRPLLRPGQPPLRPDPGLQRGASGPGRRVRGAPAQPYGDRHLGRRGRADPPRFGRSLHRRPRRGRRPPERRLRRPARRTQRRRRPVGLPPDVAGSAGTGRRTLVHRRPRHRRLHSVRPARRGRDAPRPAAGRGRAHGGAGRGARVRARGAGEGRAGR